MSTTSRWFLLCCAPLLFAQANAMTISGTVTSHATGAPIANAVVYMTRNHSVGGQTAAQADGTYTLDATVAAGDTLSITASTSHYLPLEQPLDAAAPQAHVDFALLGAATIAGHVRMPAGAPIGNASVVVALREFQVQPDGSYVADDVYPSAYSVCAGGPATGTLLQCFDHSNQTSPLDPPDYSPVVVAAEEHRTGVDFDLSYGGSISGRMIDAHTGQPLGDYRVRFRFYDVHGNVFAMLNQTSLADGTYRIRGFPPGDYYLLIDSAGPFSDSAQRYPNLPCTAEDCDISQGQRLTIAGTNEIGNVDFTFHPSAIIHGHVLDATTGAPIVGAKVNTFIYASSGPGGGTYYVFWSATSRPPDGAYELYVTGGPGERWGYPLSAEDIVPYVNTVYPDVPCMDVQNCLHDADRVLIIAGETLEDVDIHAPAGAAIQGSVVADDTALPFANGAVSIYDETGSFMHVNVLADGTYATRAFVVIAGHHYYAMARSWWWPFPCSVYDAIDCPAVGAPISSVNPTPIQLQPGHVRTGIDFSMHNDGIFHGTFEWP